MSREVPVDFLKSLNPKALPAAPGHNWEDAAFAKTHSKPQTLSREFAGKSYRVNTSILQESNKKGLAAGTLPDYIQTKSARQLVQSLGAAIEGRSEELSHKTFTTLDDKVLRFYAYFTELVRESAVETERNRRVTIQYYPFDETILIQEPVLPNSGIQGGTLLKRQRVTANPRQREMFPDDDHVTINHLNVGIELVLNSVVYTIYACDAFTRGFMLELGVPLNPDEYPPEDAYSRKMRHLQETAAAGNFGVTSQDRLLDDVIRTQRFLQDSGTVLYFKGVYDDRENAGGRVRMLSIAYFVEDDSMSITEIPVGGEVVPSRFLGRRRLPKDGKMEKTVELTFKHRVNGMRETNLGSPDAYYVAQDLAIGAIVNIFGRPLVLYDCDDFTRTYYLQQFGVDLGERIDPSSLTGLPAELLAPERAPRGAPPSLPVPPSTGFGSHEDSMSSCKVKCFPLKAPRGHVLNPHSKNDVLRFQMKLAKPDRPEDENRVFILSYYVDDGEVMVQETALRNSGFTGGKFCRKQRIAKFDNGVTPVWYTLDDFRVGNKVVVNKFEFVIVNYDEHTENHLTFPDTQGVHPEAAQKVSRDRTMELLTALRGFLTVRYVTQTEAFRSLDRDRDGNITLHELLAGLKAHLITDKEHEAIAVLQQISDSHLITHSDLLKWLAAPLRLKETSLLQSTDLTGKSYSFVDTVKARPALQEASALSSQNSVRNRLLRALKEKLESRCLNGFEMFRLASTMPRAYKGRRAEINCLTNPQKDVYITPVQLRRCVEEILGMQLSQSDVDELVAFFFPALPAEEFARRHDQTLEHRVELTDFQTNFNKMSLIDQLPPK